MHQFNLMYARKNFTIKPSYRNDYVKTFFCAFSSPLSHLVKKNSADKLFIERFDEHSNKNFSNSIKFYPPLGGKSFRWKQN